MAENTSFLPEDYLEKRVTRRTNIICISLFVVVMVGVVAAFLVTDRQRSEIKAQQASVNKQFEEAAKRLEQLEQLQAQVRQMKHKAKVTSVLVERVPRTLLLAEVVNHMPAQLSLLEFDLKTEVTKAPPARTAMQRQTSKSKAKKKEAEADAEFLIEVPETEVTVKMVGVAPTDVEVAQFITAMSNHPLFHGAILQYSEQTTVAEREMRKFGIEMRLAQDVDLRTVQPTMVKRDLKMDPMSGTIQITGGQVGTTPPQGAPVSNPGNPRNPRNPR